MKTNCEKAPAVVSRRWKQAEQALQQFRTGETEGIGGFGFDVYLEQPYRSRDISSQEMLHFHVPESASSIFVGHKDLLKALQHTFFPNGSATDRPSHKSFVIFGMGGCGKTELCSKFAMENRQQYYYADSPRANVY